MMFWIKVLKVNDTVNQDARDFLNKNCTHADKDYWFYEGDEEAIHEGIDFEIVGEEAIGGLGDLTGLDLKKLLAEYYGISEKIPGIAARESEAIMSFVNLMIGALDSGFVEKNNPNLSQIYQTARNYIKDEYSLEVRDIVEVWGEDTAALCGLEVNSID